MKVMKIMKFITILLIVAMLVCGCASADIIAASWEVNDATEPFWSFPLSQEIMADPDGFLVLANTEHLLSSTFKPDDLVNIAVRKTSSTAIQMRRPVSQALSAMFEAALADGLKLYAASGFRSYQTQKTQYAMRLERVGYDDNMVQKPGASDHQTGLGIDVVNYSMIGQRFSQSFINTKEGQWLADHCYEYGFIIRYLKGKKDVTGINYEPWHLRYVGEEAARYINDNSLTLEEFWDEWEAYQSGEWIGTHNDDDTDIIIDDGALIIEN
ncbi:hypothetical protein AGMMS49992_09300 [Clostridia bacterium]|nr:hypothetical protein AGMMS49992_09300 [Clostridia bacterium]